MAMQRRLFIIFPIAICALTASFARADAELSEELCLQDKPRIEAYEDYNDFLVDVIRYKKRQKPCVSFMQEIAREHEEKLLSSSPNAELIEIDSITGHEDLNTAVQRAKGFSHPFYSSSERYNRSTSQSFALPKVVSNDLSGQTIDGLFSETAAGEPLTYNQMSEISLQADSFSTASHDKNNDELAFDRGKASSPALVPISYSTSASSFTDSLGNTTQIYSDGYSDLLTVKDVQIRR